MKKLLERIFWGAFARHRIMEAYDIPEGYYIEKLSMFTAERMKHRGKTCVIAYTEIRQLSGSNWTNGHILYDFSTGKRLSKFVGGI